MIETWFFGFHRPWLRNEDGFSLRGALGHVEVWGYTVDDTWLFIDPQGKGSIVTVTHHHDDVIAHLSVRHTACETILRFPAVEPVFRLPLHGPMTCASICGHLVGVRALFPATLKRKLLAKGAEVVHAAEGKPGSSGCAPS